MVEHRGDGGGGVLDRNDIADAARFDAEFANQGRVVAGGVQEGGITREGEVGVQGWGVEGELVAALVEAGENAGATGRADRGGGEGAAKAGAAAGQPRDATC